MAKSRARKSGRNGHRGPPPRTRSRSAPLTLSFEEAAQELQMRPRTLLGHLRRTDAPCLVRIGNRYRLDRKGFFKWCRRLGFESASPQP
jgi:hypothetical protein